MIELKPINNLFAIDGIYEAKRFEICEGLIRCFSGKTERSWVTDVRLPAGNYIFLFTSKDVTEKQAVRLVQVEPAFRNKCKPCYKNYDIKPPFGFSVLNSAMKSFNSLLSRNGINTKKNYAIVQLISE